MAATCMGVGLFTAALVVVTTLRGGCAQVLHATGHVPRHVSCVNRTADLENEIRDTCCPPLSNCRRFSFGAPTECKSACAALVVPVFKECGYMFGPMNNTIPDSAGKSQRPGSGFSLAALFDMCTAQNPAKFPATKDVAVPQCPATKLGTGKGLVKHVRDYDKHWEMCSLNVPRLSEFCRADPSGCLKSASEELSCVLPPVCVSY